MQMTSPTTLPRPATAGRRFVGGHETQVHQMVMEQSHQLISHMRKHLFQELRNIAFYTGTLCIQNDTTNTDFSYIESQKMLFVVGITQFPQKISDAKVFNGLRQKRTDDFFKLSALSNI